MYKCLIYVPGRKLPIIKWVRNKTQSFKFGNYILYFDNRAAIYHNRFYKLVFFSIGIEATQVTWEKEYEPTR